MSLEDYVKNSLWPILVETVHALVMYPHHKSYTREVVLNEKPNIKSNELAARLGVPLGEALVILHELKEQIG
jgi:hypothetical protein